MPQSCGLGQAEEVQPSTSLGGRGTGGSSTTADARAERSAAEEMRTQTESARKTRYAISITLAEQPASRLWEEPTPAPHSVESGFLGAGHVVASLWTPALGPGLTVQRGGRMAPTPTRATPARERMRGHCCPGGHGDAGQRGLPQNLHRRRSRRLGREGRGHSGVAQEKCPRGAGMHVGARPGRAPATVADGPQARVGAAETEREAGCEVAWETDAITPQALRH